MKKIINLLGMLIVDSVAFVIAIFVAYMLRFEFSIPNEFLIKMIDLLPFIIVIKIGVFWFFRLYKEMWRYTNFYDLWRLSLASFIAEIFIFSALTFVVHFVGYPRAAFVGDLFFTFLFTGCARILVRSIYTIKRGGFSQIFTMPFYQPKNFGLPTLIIGAGDNGQQMANEIIHSPKNHDFALVGFIDNDQRKAGRMLYGKPIFGDIAIMPEIVQRLKIKNILIAIPNIEGDVLQKIIHTCRSVNVKFQVLPSMKNILAGNVSLSDLREVDFKDLLRRPEISLERKVISDYLLGKVILVTGAGGSIGSELCRQIIKFSPKLLIMLDSGEENLYAIQMALVHEFQFQNYKNILGSIQDTRLVEDIFNKYKPEVVFHAAAYKHVPMLEDNPWEAIFNNVQGSKCMMEAAVRHKIDRFVVVSTDKAVRPTNIMGTTKRITELLSQHIQQTTETKFMSVRFGNVVGSSGSVIPLFQDQIKRGGPVTVTHPDVIRYFMTIPEAAQLILQAGALGDGGEIFVLNMGTPVKIAEMAKDLIRLSGKTEQEVPIIFTGLRAGEKLYEELITEGEDIVTTKHKDIMVLCSDTFRTSKENSAIFYDNLDKLKTAADNRQTSEIKAILGLIVPEYTPQDSSSLL